MARPAEASEWGRDVKSPVGLKGSARCGSDARPSSRDSRTEVASRRNGYYPPAENCRWPLVDEEASMVDPKNGESV